MSSSNIPMEYEAVEASPRRRGCFFYGCLLGIVVFFIGSVGIYIAVDYAYRTFTSDRPADLPSLDFPAAEYDEVRRRVDAFTQELENGTTGASLTLDTRALNVLIQRDPAFSLLAGRAVADIRPDAVRIRGSISLPLGSTERYFNGVVDVRPVKTESGIDFEITPLQIGDERLPSVHPFTTGKTSKSAFWQRIGEVKIENGSIALKGR